ncbi:hypothetical protein PSP6_60289 [Paraburkholderia tropica]|nr:hypothetical protein PSP6_60289 [Paraburkholderia tropica]
MKCLASGGLPGRERRLRSRPVATAGEGCVSRDGDVIPAIITVIAPDWRRDRYCKPLRQAVTPTKPERSF